MENIKEKYPERIITVDLTIRWRIIGYLEAGKKQQDAGLFYGVSKGEISKLWKKYQETGTVEDRQRSGRPKKIRTKMKADISKKMEEEKYTSSRQIGAYLGICHQSVINYAHEIGFHFKYYQSIPKLNELHKLARKNHCLKWKDQDLSKIIFADESYLHLFRNTLGTWTKEDKVYVEQINPNKALMIWGAICTKGKSKISIKEFGLKWNQEIYIDILENHLLPFGDEIYGNKEWFFLQDNARIHIGKKTQNFLQESEVVLAEHPAYSPDLNPIELIWKFLKDEVEKKSPQNLEELKQGIEQAWEGIDLEVVQNCVEHVKNRMKIVFDANGEFI